MSKRTLLQVITVTILFVTTLALSPISLGKASRALATYSAVQKQVLLSVSSPVSVPADLLNTATTSAMCMRINEVMFYPGAGGNEWVELKNCGSASIFINGWRITDEDDNSYTIPDAVPPVPRGAFVVIVFDGAGTASDDYDFGDNRTTLHTPPGLLNIFGDSADQCALHGAFGGVVYLPLILKRGLNSAEVVPPTPGPSTDPPPPTVISFVAWGAAAGDDGSDAADAGIWGEGLFVSPAGGAGVVPPGASFAPGGSIGLASGSDSAHFDDWVVFGSGDVSPGEQNPVLTIPWHYPASGATIDSSTFSISWAFVTGATGYQFQMDNDSGFGSPEVDITLTDPAYTPGTSVAEGTYYWRVKTISAGGESSWTSGVQIKTVDLSGHGVTGQESQTLGITWQLQHKDTNMLCLDGDGETGGNAWDSPHTSRGIHGNMYCVRASTSMLASYYGGELSQDRITYHLFGGGAPEGDLGHDIGCSVSQADDAVDWALGTNLTNTHGIPTFQQVRDWIDADRPIGSAVAWPLPGGGGHMRVIDGYKVTTTTVPSTVRLEWIHLLDPWDSAKWIVYTSDTASYVGSWVWVGPAGTGGAPSVRSDEDADNDGVLDTVDDSDGDGICDFDERTRFGGLRRHLDPSNPDSDGDLVPDKVDMRGHVFDDAGNYSRRPSDYDWDFNRKEVDPDNDNFWDTGSIDGCEDANQNGKLDPGESSNFSASDENICASPIVTITNPSSGSTVDDCVISLEGDVTSSTPLSSTSALVMAGSLSNVFDLAASGSAPSYSFSQDVPLFSGDNWVVVNATNAFGSGSDFVDVNCTQSMPDIHVQMEWALLGSDVDVHLIRPGGTYFTSPGDCFYRNTNPDWGVPGDSSDDPELDIDCITQCTLENIVLSHPVTGTYTVKLHYYSDHGRGATNPAVRIWVQGVRHDFGPTYMVDDQVWQVATIEWPSMTVSSLGAVSSLSALDHPPIPEK